MRIGSIIIFHLSKLWKAKFFILCDVIFLVRLQETFDIDQSHSWEPWKGNTADTKELDSVRKARWVLGNRQARHSVPWWHGLGEPTFPHPPGLGPTALLGKSKIEAIQEKKWITGWTWDRCARHNRDSHSGPAFPAFARLFIPLVIWARTWVHAGLLSNTHDFYRLVWWIHKLCISLKKSRNFTEVHHSGLSRIVTTPRLDSTEGP